MVEARLVQEEGQSNSVHKYEYLYQKYTKRTF